MKKKYIIIAALLVGIVSAATAQKKLNVVASASIFRDMVEQIGGDKIEAYSIVPIGGDPHLYEPKPSDATLLKNADIVLVNGLTFEGWINDVIKNSGTKAKVYTITDGVNVLASDTYKNAADPHAWMDASNGLIYTDNIKKALVEASPEHKAYFEEKHKAYRQQIEELDAYIKREIQKIPEAYRMIVTSHDAFAYYGRRYGLELNALKGISTEAETQTSDMVRVSKAIRQSGVPAIFVESTISPKVIQQIARDNNVKIGGELFADSLGEEDSEGATYIDMLRHNTDVIVKALSNKEISKTKIDEDKSGNSMLIYLILATVMLGALGFLISKFKK